LKPIIRIVTTSGHLCVNYTSNPHNYAREIFAVTALLVQNALQSQIFVVNAYPIRFLSPL